LYLATTLDLAPRRLLGWSMGDHHDATLVIDALDAAVAARGRRTMDGTIFHSDRGAEYTSAACRTACDRLGLSQSTGRTGSCLDNAVAESFFASLKVELVNRYRFATRAQARQAIFAWIVRYNRRRLHSTLGFMPPIEWEERHGHTLQLPSTVWPHNSGVRPPGGGPGLSTEIRPCASADDCPAGSAHARSRSMS
jgi:putative transposase